MSTVVRLIPRSAALSCPGKVRVSQGGCICGISRSHYEPCGFTGPLALIDAAAHCPWCGKILRWPRNAS